MQHQAFHDPDPLAARAGLCPGPHRGPGLPPAARELFAGTALCPDCHTVSRVCPNAECGGRSRAGSFFCRVCGERLPGAWRNEFWTELDPDLTLAAPAVARTFAEREVGSDPIHLAATDAWIALTLGERLLFLEPGPGFATVFEHRLEPRELFVDLRGGEDPPAWELLTSRQVLRFDPRASLWRPIERFPAEDGELIWQSRGLRALYRPGLGSSLWLRSPLKKLMSVPGLLSSPAWLPDSRYVCTDDKNVYLGSLVDPMPPARFPAKETLSAFPPVFEAKTARVFLPGEKTLMWWQSGGKDFIPFQAAGHGAVLECPQGVVLLEGDRLQLLRPDGRRLWDSRTVMPDFSRSSLSWDRAGDALLVPIALRGAATPMLLMDLKSPGRLWRTEVAAGATAQACLAPGGIVAAVQRGTESRGSLDLVWIAASSGSAVAA